MLDALRKRGPDDTGVWSGHGHRSVLGHTRLSIIDLCGSIQPMANEDETVVVTYNGEIYNYQDLRRFLMARGHTFRTQGDTEVLVHLYEECGPQMVERLDGMFAFGIYDARHHTLLLARDRVGIKPLYYWWNPATEELLFASDMNAMLANPAVPRHLNPQALAQYLHFGFVVHPESWLEQVAQLEPGQILLWKDGKLQLSTYYHWRYEPRADLANKQAATAELDRVLYDSVASHLIADVPLGSFLSGGVDSATITGLAQRARQQSGRAIHSFTVRFWATEYDESARARAIARDLGTNHTEAHAKELPFDRASMDNLIESMGEPFADTSALAVYLLCQQARPRVKVALSGDGGDEIFYGYEFFKKQQFARRLRLAPTPLRRVAAHMTSGSRSTLPRRFNKYTRLSLLDDQALIVDWHRRWEWNDLYSLLGGDLFQRLFTSPQRPFPELCERMGHGERDGFLEQQISFFMRIVLPCDFLFKVDRMSMAHGLEVRVPLLSNGMLEYATQLPIALRTRGRRTKEPLRTLAESLSATVAQPSPKHGFGFPFHQWMSEKFASYWREWELTSALGKIGFQTCELDRLITSYSHTATRKEDYFSRALTIRLFDLMLLALWIDKYHIQRSG
jgi:asparagine synthase (glutamine-hydrolysing)